MFEPVMLLLVVATFLSTGTVKAVIGLGLPTVSPGLLTAALDLPTAMALLLVPSFVRNVCQASTGGHALTILGRFRPFLVMATVTVWIGATAPTRVDLDLFLGLF
jgi:uncharacterized membrane protein YfcA